VHFGATVQFKNVETDLKQTFQLVGVDEANIGKGKLAFTTPLAKTLIKKKVGDKAKLQLGERTNVFEILSVKYLQNDLKK
jgi:transcription elongation factor GreB